MFVPVAHIDFSVYNELSTIMSRKNEPKAVTIHFRRLEVRSISLTKNKQDYYSDSLFSDSNMPCRIIVTFVDADAKIGNYQKNPYNFKRLWKITKATPIPAPGLDDFNTLQEKYADLERRFEEFTSKFHVEKEVSKRTSKNKQGQKKRSNLDKEASSSSNASFSIENTENLRRQLVSDEARLQLRRFFDTQGLRQPDEGETTSATQGAEETKTIFLKKVECELNSTPLDQIEDDQVKYC